MSVNQTNVVDAIGIDNETGELVLTIADDLEWLESDKTHFLLLQEKLNTYLGFVESGEILQAYPNASGKVVVIDVVGKYALTKLAEEFFAQIEAIVNGAGIKLRHRKFNAS